MSPTVIAVWSTPRKTRSPGRCHRASPLSGGELDQLQRVAIRILEVERADAARGGVPVGQALRRRRDLGDAMPAQPEERLIDVVHDDRQVLEPPVVAPGALGHRAPAGLAELVQLHDLLAEPEPRDPEPRAGHAREPLPAGAAGLHDAERLEEEHARVEGQGSIEIGHRQRDRPDRLHERDGRLGPDRQPPRRRHAERHGQQRGCQGARPGPARHPAGPWPHRKMQRLAASWCSLAHGTRRPRRAWISAAASMPSGGATK